MQHEWSHLPNAAHIDCVLASVKAHPEEWYAAWHATGYAARNASWNAARDSARNAARYAAWAATRLAARRATESAAWNAAWGAIAALIAWDDCAKYLDMSSDRLKVWSALSEDPACILLLPAVVAFENISIKSEVML